jgi:hypothetical protein
VNDFHRSIVRLDNVVAQMNIIFGGYDIALIEALIGSHLVYNAHLAVKWPWGERAQAAGATSVNRAFELFHEIATSAD